MRPAADALAVGVEQDDLDILQAVPGHGFGQPELETLDEVAGGKLAEKAAAVGVAELQAQAAHAAEVVAVMR